MGGNSRVKAPNHLYICKGGGYFLGLKAKCSKRSAAQACPHTRYRTYIHEQTQEGNIWYFKRAEPKSHIAHLALSLTPFPLFPPSCSQQYPAFKLRIKRKTSLGKMGRVLKELINTTSKYVGGSVSLLHQAQIC